MRLTVLGLPGCPNVEVLLSRLRTALLDPAAEIAVIVVDDDTRAADLGMTGSPTLLIDGADPFATTGAGPSMSCRLYRTEDQTIGGAPSVAQLRAVLGLK